MKQTSLRLVRPSVLGSPPAPRSGSLGRLMMAGYLPMMRPVPWLLAEYRCADAPKHLREAQRCRLLDALRALGAA